MSDHKIFVSKHMSGHNMYGHKMIVIKHMSGHNICDRAPQKDRPCGAAAPAHRNIKTGARGGGAAAAARGSG